MKKKNLKNLRLNKNSITNLGTEHVLNGGRVPFSIEPEFCNWTYNAWCHSNRGATNCAFCTAPK